MRVQSLLALLLLSVAVTARAIPIPAPPQFDARSYVLMDANSGQVIAAYNQDQHREPASLTKLMTAYAVFHALKDGVIRLDDTAVVSERAWRMGGSRMFAQLGAHISVEDLLQGMIVQSGNDATVVLAERVGGSEDAFVSIMNQYAEKLGMKDTHFVNSSGLTDDRNHYSTSHDLAVLSGAIVKEFPEYQHFFMEKDFTWNRISQKNRNDLLFTDTTVDGLKTGDTDNAGYCLIASAQRGAMRLVSVIMGAKSMKSRAVDAEALLNYGSNFFETRKLYAAGSAVGSIKVWKGETGEVATGVVDDLYITLPKGGYNELHATVAGHAGLVAPVAQHAAVGTLDISMGDRLLAQVPIYTLKAVPEGNIFKRMFDSMRLWFSKK